MKLRILQSAAHDRMQLNKNGNTERAQMKSATLTGPNAVRVVFEKLLLESDDGDY